MGVVTSATRRLKEQAVAHGKSLLGVETPFVSSGTVSLELVGSGHPPCAARRNGGVLTSPAVAAGGATGTSATSGACSRGEIAPMSAAATCSDRICGFKNPASSRS